MWLIVLSIFIHFFNPKMTRQPVNVPRIHTYKRTGSRGVHTHTRTGPKTADCLTHRRCVNCIRHKYQRKRLKFSGMLEDSIWELCIRCCCFFLFFFDVSSVPFATGTNITSSRSLVEKREKTNRGNRKCMFGQNFSGIIREWEAAECNFSIILRFDRAGNYSQWNRR